MSATEHAQQSRLLTPTDLAASIKLFREMRQWSQEQLSAISGLNVRVSARQFCHAFAKLLSLSHDKHFAKVLAFGRF